MKLIPRFQDGGTLDERQKEILKRSEVPQTAWNYHKAVDGDIPKARAVITRNLDSHKQNIREYPGLYWGMNPFLTFIIKNIPTKLQNCTLTATQWINPNMPLMKAENILNNGSFYNYMPIPEEHLIPGDLVIATNPKNNSHHSMLNIGFTHGEQQHTFNGKTYNLPDDHPLLRYSNGSTDPSGYRKSIGLMEYMDNSDGKSQLNYFRYMNPDDYIVLAPQITVTPQGSYYDENAVSTMYHYGVMYK